MKLFPTTRRDLLAKTGAAMTAAAWSSLPHHAFAQSPTPGGTVRMRKNIEKLGADDLATYKHAIQILQNNSSDPNNPKGYAYWAALHDLYDESIHSGCAHFSEKFFPWHRRYLYDFEVALQNSDPPKTKDVMIPYWDWTTKTTTGVNFPAPFEDPNSPLFDNTRQPVPQPPWNPDQVRKMVRDPDWSAFAGKPDPSNGFGRNPGSVEFGPHNTLHTMISSDMADPSSAVQDPIFWSFHAGIDLCWSRWQHRNLTNSKPQPFVDPDAVLWFQDRSFKVGTTGKTADYFYEYDYDYSSDAPTSVAATEAVVASASINNPAKNVVPFRVSTEKGKDLTMEAATPSPSSTVLRLADVKYFRDRSYRLNLYLHPKSVEISSLNADARKQYFMDVLTLWKAHHDGAAELFVKPTPEQAAHLADGWVVTIQSEAVAQLPAAKTAAAPAGGHAAHTESVAPSGELPPTSALVKSLELQER
jgi:tyrosinase